MFLKSQANVCHYVSCVGALRRTTMRFSAYPGRLAEHKGKLVFEPATLSLRLQACSDFPMRLHFSVCGGKGNY